MIPSVHVKWTPRCWHGSMCAIQSKRVSGLLKACAKRESWRLTNIVFFASRLPIFKNNVSGRCEPCFMHLSEDSVENAVNYFTFTPWKMQLAKVRGFLGVFSDQRCREGSIVSVWWPLFQTAHGRSFFCLRQYAMSKKGEVPFENFLAIKFTIEEKPAITKKQIRKRYPPLCTAEIIAPLDRIQ